MNRIIIYILCSFLAISGTWVANRFQLRKAVKPYKKQVSVLRTDSAFTAKKIQKMVFDSTARWKSDSLKSEFIGQMQGTLYQLKKENTYLAKQNAELTAWKLDAEDGVITDTVRVGIFGKIRKKKK